MHGKISFKKNKLDAGMCGEGKYERFLGWRAVLVIHWRRACLFDKRGDETAVPSIFALCVVVAAIGLLLQRGGKCISVDHAFSPRPSIGGGMVKHEKAMTSVCRSHRFYCFPACKDTLISKKNPSRAANSSSSSFHHFSWHPRQGDFHVLGFRFVDDEKLPDFL